jgi:hypothetical protein
MGKLAPIAILAGGGLIVFFLYRYLSSRQSAQAVVTPLAKRLGAIKTLDAWATDVGQSWEKTLENYVPEPPKSTPPPPVPPTLQQPRPADYVDPMCGPGGMHWDPIRGACVF